MNNFNKITNLLNRSIFVCVLLFCAWLVIGSAIKRQETGILHIESAESNVGLIIGQYNHQSKSVGVGTARIRLKPGSYYVSAIRNGEQSNAVVEVHKKQITNISLPKVASYTLPSSQDIDFNGTGSLIANGLTSNQISDLHEAFFQFKRTTKVVTVDSGSVALGPYNSNVDTSSSITFNVSVDSVLYKAVVQSSNLEDIQLFLYNYQNNKLVYDKSVLSDSQGGD